jgi:hypothetical protein
MGRELHRVPLDFDWPLNKPWKGYVNPRYTAQECTSCAGSGYSPEAARLHEMWYGHAPFKPEDNGSVPFTETSPEVRDFAERNVANAPEYYGTGETRIRAEAIRLCDLFNSQWSHHLNKEDVAALVDAGRLMDLTHTWTKGEGWVKKSPAYMPTPEEVNSWSIPGMGHDSINAWVCLKARCERMGVAYTCADCDGEGDIWPSKADEERYESWERENPPSGDGYQIWETVSEGSPISPVFSTATDLARHMATTKWGADDGTPFEVWMKFIEGPGWAPSMVGSEGRLMNGVTGVVEMEST